MSVSCLRQTLGGAAGSPLPGGFPPATCGGGGGVPSWGDRLLLALCLRQTLGGAAGSPLPGVFPPRRLAVVSWGAFMLRFASALCLRQTSGKTLPEGGSRVGSEGRGRRSTREWRLVGSSEARQMGAVAARPPCLRQTSSQRCSYRCQQVSAADLAAPSRRDPVQSEVPLSGTLEDVWPTSNHRY